MSRITDQPPPVEPSGLFHTGIVVPDVDVTKDELSSALGIRWHPVAERLIRMVTPSGEADVLMRYCYSTDGPHFLELIQGIPETTWDTSDGPRLHHLGYGVPDVPAAADHLSRLGLARVGSYSPSPEAGPAFTYHQSPSSPLLEIVAPAVRQRVTAP